MTFDPSSDNTSQNMMGRIRAESDSCSHGKCWGTRRAQERRIKETRRAEPTDAKGVSRLSEALTPFASVGSLLLFVERRAQWQARGIYLSIEE
ncbi:MAG: hypothetical protein MN733_17770 [Nitrososphaera sp.]|nr:hypothetical protein [Nitrososphaera sp.]